MAVPATMRTIGSSHARQAWAGYAMGTVSDMGARRR